MRRGFEVFCVCQAVLYTILLLFIIISCVLVVKALDSYAHKNDEIPKRKTEATMVTTACSFFIFVHIITTVLYFFDLDIREPPPYITLASYIVCEIIPACSVLLILRHLPKHQSGPGLNYRYRPLLSMS